MPDEEVTKNIHSVHDVLADPPEPSKKDWSSFGILRPGARVLLFGDAETGKSALVQQLAFDAAGGGVWLGMVDIYQRLKVLFVQGEIAPDMFAERVYIMAQNYEPDVPNFYFATEFDLAIDEKAGFEKLAGYVEAVRPHLLIVDNVSTFLAGDENSFVGLRPLRVGVNMLMEEYGHATVLIHHTPKQHLGEPVEWRGARGHSSLSRGWPDTSLYVERAGKKYPNKRLLSIVKARNMSETVDPIPVLLDREKFYFNLERTGEDEKLGDELVLSFIDRFPVQRELIDKLVEQTGCADKTVRRKVQKLAGARVVGREKVGRDVVLKRRTT